MLTTILLLSTAFASDPSRYLPESTPGLGQIPTTGSPASSTLPSPPTDPEALPTPDSTRPPGTSGGAGAASPALVPVDDTSAFFRDEPPASSPPGATAGLADPASGGSNASSVWVTGDVAAKSALDPRFSLGGGQRPQPDHSTPSAGASPAVGLVPGASGAAAASTENRIIGLKELCGRGIGDDLSRLNAQGLTERLLQGPTRKHRSRVSQHVTTPSGPTPVAAPSWMGPPPGSGGAGGVTVAAPSWMGPLPGSSGGAVAAPSWMGPLPGTPDTEEYRIGGVGRRFVAIDPAAILSRESNPTFLPPSGLHVFNPDGSGAGGASAVAASWGTMPHATVPVPALIPPPRLTGIAGGASAVTAPWGTMPHPHQVARSGITLPLPPPPPLPHSEGSFGIFDNHESFSRAAYFFVKILQDRGQIPGRCVRVRRPLPLPPSHYPTALDREYQEMYITSTQELEDRMQRESNTAYGFAISTCLHVIRGNIPQARELIILILQQHPQSIIHLLNMLLSSYNPDQGSSTPQPPLLPGPSHPLSQPDPAGGPLRFHPPVAQALSSSPPRPIIPLDVVADVLAHPGIGNNEQLHEELGKRVEATYCQLSLDLLQKLNLLRFTRGLMEKEEIRSFLTELLSIAGYDRGTFDSVVELYMGGDTRVREIIDERAANAQQSIASNASQRIYEQEQAEHKRYSDFLDEVNSVSLLSQAINAAARRLFNDDSTQPYRHLIPASQTQRSGGMFDAARDFLRANAHDRGGGGGGDRHLPAYPPQRLEDRFHVARAFQEAHARASGGGGATSSIKMPFLPDSKAEDRGFGEALYCCGLGSIDPSRDGTLDSIKYLALHRDLDARMWDKVCILLARAASLQPREVLVLLSEIIRDRSTRLTPNRFGLTEDIPQAQLFLMVLLIALNMDDVTTLTSVADNLKNVTGNTCLHFLSLQELSRIVTARRDYLQRRHQKAPDTPIQAVRAEDVTEKKPETEHDHEPEKLNRYFACLKRGGLPVVILSQPEASHATVISLAHFVPPYGPSARQALLSLLTNKTKKVFESLGIASSFPDSPLCLSTARVIFDEGYGYFDTGSQDFTRAHSIYEELYREFLPSKEPTSLETLIKEKGISSEVMIYLMTIAQERHLQFKAEWTRTPPVNPPKPPPVYEPTVSERVLQEVDRRTRSGGGGGGGGGGATGSAAGSGRYGGNHSSSGAGGGARGGGDGGSGSAGSV